MAESSDGGATWTYRGTADISYGKNVHPDGYTYWAPEVIWFNGTYHMYLSYVPGIFTDWNHPREIVHLTSKNGIKWDTVARWTSSPSARLMPVSSSFRATPKELRNASRNR
jgi:sucrose-6-phosphate hydrolase SacC (GH32 family)